MILDRAMERGSKGSLYLCLEVNSFNYLCSRFYKLLFGNFDLRRLLTALPMR
jgi:hypothetical protein